MRGGEGKEAGRRGAARVEGQGGWGGGAAAHSKRCTRAAGALAGGAGGAVLRGGDRVLHPVEDLADGDHKDAGLRQRILQEVVHRVGAAAQAQGWGGGGGEEGNRGEYECISPCISLRERGLPQLLEQAREHRPTDRRLT